MEFDPYRYPRMVLPAENVYADIFFDRRDLKEYIPFTHNTNAPIHRWFYFEHGFSSKLIDILLSEMNATKNNTLFDPFCGIGTAPVTSIMKGIPSYGSDISPFCVFVTNTKLKALCQVDNEELLKVMKWFSKKPLNPPSDSTYESDFAKLFSENRWQDILSIRELIEQIEESIVRDLCKLALLSIVEHMNRNLQDILSVNQLFISKLAEMSEDLLYVRANKKMAEVPDSKAIVGDARDLILDKRVDIVITSPPYLDFHDYTQLYEREHVLYFVSTSEELRKIRHKTIRSHSEARFSPSSVYRSDILVKLLENIAISNSEHKSLACDYFEDIWLVFKTLSKNIERNGLVFFIVENVKYDNVIIDIDTLLVEIAANTGFSAEGILVTNQRRNNRRDSIVVVRRC